MNPKYVPLICLAIGVLHGLIIDMFMFTLLR